MAFRITIHEFTQEAVENAAVEQPPIKLYEQTVTDLDLPRIIAAINAKKRVYTKRQPKAQP